jgi:hypothetical protein
LICIHHPGDRSYGWSYDAAVGGSINDCPVEGTTDCLSKCTQKGDKTAQQCKDFCGLGTNSLGQSNLFLTGANAGQSNCNAEAAWESCYGINGPPITSLVNYKQFAVNAGGEPVRFVWQGTGSAGSSLAEKSGKVYLATSDLLTEISTVASGLGAVHLADLNPTTGIFSVVNQSKGADMHSQGQACYNYTYQCSSYNTDALQKLNW